MGFLGDPQQGAALAHLVAVLGATGFLDRKARGKLDGASGLGAEAVVGELRDHLTVSDLAARGGIEAVADVVLALEVPDLAGVGGFTNQLAVFEGETGGNNLYLAGVTGAVAQAHGAAVLAHQAAFGQHFPGGDGLVAAHHGQGIGGQVVNVSAEHPHPAQALGLEGDVALAVGDLLGLDRILVTNLTGQVADHVLGGLLNALFNRHASSDLGQDRISGHGVAISDKQDRAANNIELLQLALTRGLNAEGEVCFG